MNYPNYTSSLIAHIKNVQQAGDKLGVPAAQLALHDISKWSEQEFPFYEQNFFGDKGNPQGFAQAWLHHIHHNPHHWQHWMFPDSFKSEGVVNGCLWMPPNYVLEMVADWMGSSMTYTGSWDMSAWLDSNYHKVKLHPDSNDTLDKILGKWGYYAPEKNSR